MHFTKKGKAVAVIALIILSNLIRKKHTEDIPEKFFSYAALRTR